MEPTEAGTTATTRSVDAGLRETLRRLSVLAGSAPPFDPGRAPAEPLALFTEWLCHAIESGVAEPHAMTLSTVDETGRPWARVLICKDVTTDGGWHFAVSSISRRGRQLSTNPVAALTFYWPQLGRQIRVSGPVVRDPDDIAAADFLARPAGSREMALTRRQSEPYSDQAELDAALATARAELATAPDLVPAEWTSYAVVADTVEFWQSDTTRRHVRVQYQRADGGWTRTLLWP
ncbi:pyridoxine/pyridoxamine 5'-phosphate oxidase [Mycolicibacterium komossense]|uniref:Pyridoxal 5'-phosphate synthase n=1 Tax=Mycolicibacterium komossense TaxID=1779 RepID=A0ABT3C6G7_9MYCO|nr:pyridoxal 5'-phosphate synthase [Mycolicibacterium komossense]MCV7225053.1 pyridoxal 5'-phosphate synthase [Mycolicibacterium komossense]